ncbi:hypothetical protein [Streptomyces sp. UG1]|uniref:hypothetical protein n=1 Tax=Streptomyces sp. UG1 TaxID=3417652 RepID=UPI003CF9FF4C
MSEDGAEGWGETCPIGPTYAEAHAKGARAALAEMALGLIGADLWPLALHRRMETACSTGTTTRRRPSTSPHTT